jgi:MarR family transcriptional regulator, organic hydroperoxide resistance regulator
MADADRYYFLLVRAANVVRRGSDAQAIAAAGVTTAQAGALMAIAAGDAPSQRELGRELALGEPAVTGLVGRLARLGLVERVADPDDARTSRLRITDAGREAIDAVEPARLRVGKELARLLGADGPRVAAALERLAAFDPPPG